MEKFENAEMATTSDTADLTSRDPGKGSNMDTKSKIILFCVVVANITALVALILAFVGVANNGDNQYYIGSTSTEGASAGDRIWSFQIGHFVGNTQYLDEASGTVKGYNVDVVNAVCQMANKNCRLVWDLYERCWDSQVGQRARGGEGLMGGWYDACVGWANTRDRARTFLFSTSFEKAFTPTYWVKPGDTFNYPDFTGLKVGILDGWSVDEHCLARYDGLVGFNQLDTDQVIHYPSEDAVVDALQNDLIDVAFLPQIPYLDAHTDVELAYTPDVDMCVFGGPAMMMRKDQTELASWFNAAFENLKATSQYQQICDNIKEVHGSQPGNDPSYVCVD